MSQETQQWQAVGRRKAAVARVYLRPGTGGMTINGRGFEEYFPRPTGRMVMMQPMELTETTEKFDVYVNVRGGGLSGQVGAIRLGITRALMEFDPSLRGARRHPRVTSFLFGTTRTLGPY